METSEARGAVRREDIEARVPLAALQRVTDAALAHLALDDLLAALLERVAEVLRSDTAAFLLIDDDDERMLRARAAKGIEEEVEQGVRIPVGRGFAGRVVEERRAVVIPDVEHSEVLNPILREMGARYILTFGQVPEVSGPPYELLYQGSDDSFAIWGLPGREAIRATSTTGVASASVRDK